MAILRLLGLCLIGSWLLASCTSVQPPGRAAQTCYDPSLAAPETLFGDGTLHLDIAPGISAIARKNTASDFVVYDFVRGNRQIGGMYLGNAPGLFGWPEESVSAHEPINGLAADTRRSSTPDGVSRETLITVSVTSFKSPSGAEMAQTVGWPAFAHLWYRGQSAVDGRIMDGVIDSVSAVCRE
jgi:hypothetical protein